MADDNGDDTPMRTEEESSASGSGSGSGSDTEEEQVEWMVTARQPRSTAGNRLTSLLQQEEPDDDLELLFAEADDDAGFEDVEADQSDVQMDSSDDDEDQGPSAPGADDLEGEQELQRQTKAERAKKRKLNDGIPKVFKKRVKIDPTASQSPGPRAKKKSERASWIPTAEEAPTRASQRGTTRQSKEQLHAQMVYREKKRLKQLANMEKAAAAKQAAKKPALTQADRLAEAARVEKSNSKSLSRWEEAEQLREEEQRAKLAALSNRHMDGPVITWWSGIAEWVGGRLRQVGKTLTIEEHKEKPKKRKAAEMEGDTEAGPADLSKPGVSTNLDQPMTDTPPPPAPAPPDPAADPAPLNSTLPPTNGTLPENSETLDNSSSQLPPQLVAVPTESNTQTPTTPLPEPSTAPPNILSASANNQTSPTPLEPPTPQPAAPSAPIPPNTPPSIVVPPLQVPPPAPALALDGSIVAPPLQLSPPAPASAPALDGSIVAPPLQLPPPAPALTLDGSIVAPPLQLPPPAPAPALDGSAPLPGLGYNAAPPQLPHSMTSQTTPFTFDPSQPQNQGLPSPQLDTVQPPAIEHAARNYLILSNFDEAAIKLKDVQTQILFNRKFLKAPKPKAPSLCAITSFPAKYRDPTTGLAYCNSYAYKEIQRLKRGEYRWSALVGAYVGQGTYAARGVPSRFVSALASKASQPQAQAVKQN